MGRIYTSTVNGKPLNIASGQPLDVRCVVQSVDDLVVRTILQTSYVGMVVYVVDDESLYACYYKPSRITNTIKVEDCWRKVNIDYSVRIVESVSNLTDGTILFPFQGMMAYVTSESSLYILLEKGIEQSRKINNWKKISSADPSTTAPSIDKVGIDVAPEGGSGFKIVGNEDVEIDDYVNAENYIKASYSYTSNGVNSFEPSPYFDYESVKLSKGGDGDVYIELYTNGDNWIKINDPDNTLGLSVSIDGVDYVSGTPIAKETPVCFGVDIKFHEGWKIAFGDIDIYRDFAESDYELIDIFRSELSPMVYAYRKDIDVRMLTEDDLINIDEKIDNLAHSIMIDLDGESDGSDSDVEVAKPLQQVIVQMNNAITKLEQTTVEPDPIEHSEIDGLFS